MEEILAYQIWLKIPLDTRAKLATLFGISKTGQSVVNYRSDGAIITQDGYSPDDLRAITVRKMQEKLITEETDFYALFETAVDNIDSLVAGTYAPATQGDENIEHKVERKRKEKKAAHRKK